MGEHDHEQIAEELEQESTKLERHARELEQDVERTRSEWQRKRSDPGVPGANPPRQGGEQEPSETQTPPG